MFYNFWNQRFVFFLGVLFVEDTIFLIVQTGTAETILRCGARKTIDQIGTSISTFEAKKKSRNVDHTDAGFVNEFRSFTSKAIIHTVVGTFVEVEAVFQILPVLNKKTFLHIPRLRHEVSCAIFRLMKDGMGSGVFFHKLLKLLLILLSFLPGAAVKIFQELFIFLFCFFFIENAVLAAAKIHASEAIPARAAEGQEKTVAAIFAALTALEIVTPNTIEAVVASL